MTVVKRSYHAPVRTEQAAQTRRRVLQAAAESFTERGWAGTTIADIRAPPGSPRRPCTNRSAPNRRC